MMKFVLLVAVVLAVVWLLRSGRRRGLPPASGRAPQVQEQEEMVACAHCGVHLPRSEALPGRGGVFCGEAHRLAFEKADRGR